MSTKGGIEENLHINSSAPLPKPKPTQSLVQVIAIALNPVDYKPAEVALVSRIAITKPATPGIDFAGCVVTPATGSAFKRGQLVYGVSGTNPLAAGALREFTLTEKECMLAVPDGVDLIDAATIGTAGITAYQSIVPRVKKGDRVFINGGSGGTGVFAIQIAKAVGCHVTTTCSTANMDLCRSLGADEVVDYKKNNVVTALKAGGHMFDHVVDNVGANNDLYWQCHEYTRPGAMYIMVGGAPTLAALATTIMMRVLPGFLGGGKRQLMGFWPKQNIHDIEQIVMWMKEGQVKAVVDQKFPFEEAPEAFQKLKSGRAKGKIVIDVASETYKKAWSQ